jgi:large subunit ribosomal protein L21
MFAVVQAGGRQLQVAPADVLRIDRIKAEPGAEITLGKVLLLATDTGTHVGTPHVDGAEVRAEVLGEEKGDKIRVFFYRRRKNSKKMRGHRQRYTSVRIRSLLLGGEVIAEAQAPAKKAPKAERQPEAQAAEQQPEAQATEQPEAQAAEQPGTPAAEQQPEPPAAEQPEPPAEGEPKP